MIIESPQIAEAFRQLYALLKTSLRLRQSIVRYLRLHRKLDP
jgi:hypothetical protein